MGGGGPGQGPGESPEGFDQDCCQPVPDSSAPGPSRGPSLAGRVEKGSALPAFPAAKLRARVCSLDSPRIRVANSYDPRNACIPPCGSRWQTGGVLTVQAALRWQQLFVLEDRMIDGWQDHRPGGLRRALIFPAFTEPAGISRAGDRGFPEPNADRC